MPGIKPEEYELDTPECYLARCEAMIRAIYYCYKDSTEHGGADHEAMKMYVDSLIYNSLTVEEKIKENSQNIPTERLRAHGNMENAAKGLKEAFDSFYYNMRETAKRRIGYESRKK